jgi:hypothetical protein
MFGTVEKVFSLYLKLRIEGDLVFVALQKIDPDAHLMNHVGDF